MSSNLVYTIEEKDKEPEQLEKLLRSHPEIRFVSLVAVDFGNHHTDEKVPVAQLLDDVESFLQNGIQTDGSSVYLPEIAEIDNAKVDLIPDKSANWFVDYNPSNIFENGKPVGSLMIPAYLIHDGKEVCSRSVLKNAVANFKDEILYLFKNYPEFLAEYDEFSSVDDIEDVILTSATELEFWVKSPDTRRDIEKLSASQNLKEQYWTRIYGQVRTALEQSLDLLEAYGYVPEMGHKEVGGVAPHLSGVNTHGQVMEQMEIDWKFDKTLLAADKELFAKDLIKDVFETNGLSVTFKAKPMEGVAGNGEHHHIGAALKLKNGKMVNLFTPKDMKANFMSKAGTGALMGILKNYEVINPFVSCTTDSLNRLKPGFEAPVCIVSSLGHSPAVPSRNRTVLIGLVRDNTSRMATRFELRSPNPNSNTYLLLAAVCQSAVHGIKAVLDSGLNSDELETSLSKKYGEDHFYLDSNRVYRSEVDVFDDFTPEERDKQFTKPPSTVYENVSAFDNYPEKTELLLNNSVFTPKIVNCIKSSLLAEWSIELSGRLIPKNINAIRRYKELHSHEDVSDLDIVNWEKIKALKVSLMKDSLTTKSLFTRIKEALADGDYATASDLHVEMNTEMSKLDELYNTYKANLVSVE